MFTKAPSVAALPGVQSQPEFDPVTKVRSVRRGDHFVGFNGTVGKHISTGGRAPRVQAFGPAKKLRGFGLTTEHDEEPEEPEPTAEDRERARLNAEVLLRCADGDVARLAELLSNPLVSVNDDSGMPLQVAGAHGRLAAVEAILAHPGVEIAAPGAKALAFACYYGHLPVVQRLLKEPSIDKAADQNWALECAIETGQTECVAALLTDPAVDPEKCFAPGRALYIAAIRGYTPIVELLLRDPRCNPAAHNSSALEGAAEAKRADVVRVLLADGRADPASSNFSALTKACGSGAADVLELLLADPRVDASKAAPRMLRDAAAHGRRALLETLLARPGISPSAGNNAVICGALKHYQEGAEDTFDLLMRDSRLDLSIAAERVIEGAVSRGSEDASVLQRLLSHPSIAAQAPRLARLAIRAGSYRKKLVAELQGMLDATGAATSKLQLAAMKKQLDEVDALLSEGVADPMADDGAAFVEACASGSLAVVDRMLADPRVDPSCGRNEPLLRACGGGHTAVVERLLQDWRVNPGDRDNASLRYVLRQHGAEKIRALLRADARVAAVTERLGGEEALERFRGDEEEPEERYDDSD